MSLYPRMATQMHDAIEQYMVFVKTARALHAGTVVGPEVGTCRPRAVSWQGSLTIPPAIRSGPCVLRGRGPRPLKTGSDWVRRDQN